MNIQKAIDKLDSICRIKGVDENRLPIDSGFLRHILLSLQEPEDDRTPTHKEIIANEARRRLKMIEDRLAKVEDVFCKRLDAHFDRLVRLDEQMEVLKDFSHLHKNQEGIMFPYNLDCEPSSVSSLNEACKPFYKGDGWNPSSVSECKHEWIDTDSKHPFCKKCLCEKSYIERFEPKPTTTTEVDERTCSLPYGVACDREVSCAKCDRFKLPEQKPTPKQDVTKPSAEKCDSLLHSRIEDLLQAYLNCNPDYRSTHQTAIDMENMVKLALSKDRK